MSALPIRELIERELDNLSEEQLNNLLDYIKIMETSFGNDDYDEARDMTIGFIKGSTNAGQSTKGTFTDKSEAGRDALVGFISGPKDVAEHTEEILWAEFGLRKPDDER